MILRVSKKYEYGRRDFFPHPLQSKMGGLRAMWASSLRLLWAGGGEAALCLGNELWLSRKAFIFAKLKRGGVNGSVYSDIKRQKS